MRILVTGATGFIGNYLIPELLKTGNNIIATGVEDKKEIKKSWIDEVVYIQHDFNNNCENCYKLFQNPDRLVHLAWEGLPNYKELFHIEKNLFTSYNFIRNLVQNGTKDISILGTCFEYGMQNGPLSEDLLTMPDNPYALAKDTLRKFLEELNRHFNFNLKWIRLFYMFGEGQNKNSILELLKTSLERGDKVFNMSGGEQLRDYLPVGKVAEYISKISLSENFSGVINCCSGEPVSIRNLVENFLKENNKSIMLNLGYYPYPDYEPMAFWGDSTKLEKLLKDN